jgi:hypothetical protein
MKDTLRRRKFSVSVGEEGKSSIAGVTSSYGIVQTPRTTGTTVLVCEKAFSVYAPSAGSERLVNVKRSLDLSDTDIHTVTTGSR